MIIVLGNPGSGKSVQSQLLAQQLDYIWLSVGMLLRAQPDTSIHDQLKSGQMVDDSHVTNILEQTILSYDHPEAVVLDGFPRTLEQAEWLHGWAQRHKITIDHVIELDVPAAIARARLQDRKRTDDTGDVIAQRLANYDSAAKPILEYMKSQNIPVTAIDGSDEIQYVHEAVMKAVAQ